MFKIIESTSKGKKIFDKSFLRQETNHGTTCTEVFTLYRVIGKSKNKRLVKRIKVTVGATYFE